jgi:hypothetical protein
MKKKEIEILDYNVFYDIIEEIIEHSEGGYFTDSEREIISKITRKIYDSLYKSHKASKEEYPQIKDFKEFIRRFIINSNPNNEKSDCYFREASAFMFRALRWRPEHYKDISREFLEVLAERVKAGERQNCNIFDILIVDENLDVIDTLVEIYEDSIKLKNKTRDIWSCMREIITIGYKYPKKFEKAMPLIIDVLSNPTTIKIKDMELEYFVDNTIEHLNRLFNSNSNLENKYSAVIKKIKENFKEDSKDLIIDFIKKYFSEHNIKVYLNFPLKEKLPCIILEDVGKGMSLSFSTEETNEKNYVFTIKGKSSPELVDLSYELGRCLEELSRQVDVTYFQFYVYLSSVESIENGEVLVDEELLKEYGDDIEPDACSDVLNEEEDWMIFDKEKISRIIKVRASRMIRKDSNYNLTLSGTFSIQSKDIKISKEGLHIK